MIKEKIRKWVKITVGTIIIMGVGLFLTGSSYFLDLLYIIIAEEMYIAYLIFKDFKNKKEVK